MLSSSQIASRRFILKKITSILAILILVFALTSFTYSNSVENSDIKISADKIGAKVSSVETSWDNPNAWSLQEDKDIVKVVTVTLLDENGKKVKPEDVGDSFTGKIKVPDKYTEGFDEYKLVVFDGTKIKDYIPCNYKDGWISFEWSTIEDFGIAIPGAGESDAGTIGLDGASRERFYSMDFRKIFLYVGIGLIIMIPFCFYGAMRLTKRELQEQYEKSLEDNDDE